MADLGHISRKYESGSLGAGAVSGWIGDAGGSAYGTYQLSVRHGQVQRFLAQAPESIKNRFVGVAPGTSAFSKRWEEGAAEAPEAFATAQHDYIKRTHYEPLASALAGRFNVETASPAVKEMIWSIAVQHGQGGGERLISRALDTLTTGTNEADLIRAVYQERRKQEDGGALSYFPTLWRNAPSIKAAEKAVASLKRRFYSEEQDILAVLEGREVPVEIRKEAAEKRQARRDQITPQTSVPWEAASHMSFMTAPREDFGQMSSALDTLSNTIVSRIGGRSQEEPLSEAADDLLTPEPDMCKVE